MAKENNHFLSYLMILGILASFVDIYQELKEEFDLNVEWTTGDTGPAVTIMIASLVFWIIYIFIGLYAVNRPRKAMSGVISLSMAALLLAATYVDGLKDQILQSLPHASFYNAAKAVNYGGFYASSFFILFKAFRKEDNKPNEEG